MISLVQNFGVLKTKAYILSLQYAKKFNMNDMINQKLKRR